MRPLRRRGSLLAGLFLLALVGLATGLRAFERLELRGQSLRFRLRGPRPTGAKLVFVALDDASRARWSEPTTFWSAHYAAILDRARAEGARWVGFDIVQYSDADGYLESLGGERLLQRAGAPDATFAEALARHAGHVGLATKHDPDGAILLPNELFFLADPTGRVAQDLGFIELPLALDESVREGALYRQGEGAFVKPGFAAVAAARARGLDPTSARDLARLVPSGERTFLINYLERPVLRVSALALVEGHLTAAERESLRDAFVVVGTAHRGSQDLVQGPDGAYLPGAEMHLNALATLLDGRALRRTDPGTEAGIALGLGLLTLGLVHRLRAGFGILGIFATALVYAGAAIVVFTRWDGILPLAGPVLAVLAPPLGSLALRAVEERTERDRVERIFGTQVGRRLRDYMLGPEGTVVANGGVETEATVLFVDLRGSSAMARSGTPSETIATLNVFFDTVVPAIEGAGGIVYAFLGDGLLAVFGAPIARTDHAEAGLFAAERVIATVDALNARRRVAGQSALAFGCGVHTGPLVIGQLGATDRRQLTVVGDTVNTAARLESACKTLGVRIVASEVAMAGRSDRQDWTGPIEIDPPGTGPIVVWGRP